MKAATLHSVRYPAVRQELNENAQGIRSILVLYLNPYFW